MNDSQPFHVFLRCAPYCVLAPPVFSASIMICNECICLRLLGWHAPFYFFIPSMFPALGLHLFYKKRSSTYKPKDEVWGWMSPPIQWSQIQRRRWYRIAVLSLRRMVLGGLPQRRSNRHASQLASANIKSMYGVDEGGCKSRVPQAPKRQAVGSPEAGDVNAGDPDYAPITLTQSETDDEMQDLWDYAQRSPRSPITVSDDDCDKEQDPSLGPCTARLERISLGTDGDARASIEAKKKEAPAKRTAKRARRARKERVPGRTYRWVENCFLTKEVPDPLARFNKHLKPIGIWATCKLCLYKNPNVKPLGVKTKKTHCPSWTGCVKHVENRHCLHTPEEIDEAIADPKAHWDNLEDKKARERGVETRHQGQSTLDECVPEYGRGSGERKRCVANLARLCAVENLPLHIGSRPGFLSS